MEIITQLNVGIADKNSATHKYHFDIYTQEWSRSLLLVAVGDFERGFI